MTVYPTIAITSEAAYAGANTRAKRTPHPLIRPGTQALWDRRFAKCFPGGSVVPGSAGVGTTFKTFGWPDAQGEIFGPNAVVSGTNAWTINADGSLALPGTTAGDYLAIGTAGQFDMAPAPYEYVAIAWFALPATGYVTTAYAPLFFLSSANTNYAQLCIDMGSDGLRPRTAIGVNGTSSSSSGYAADVTPGSLVQYASHYDPVGRVLDFYANGTLVQHISGGSIPTSLMSASSAFLKMVGQLKGSLHAFSLTNIPASTAAETGMGLPAMNAADHVAADYAFGKGTLQYAPSTALG